MQGGQAAVRAGRGRSEGSSGDAVQDLLARVRAAGLKMTPQRMAIVREVAMDESHPSAQELFDRLRPGMPTMSFATVYNTLAALCAAGLGTSLSLAPGSARFDPNMHPHDHLVCVRCGAVRDLLEPAAPHSAPPRQALARVAPGFTVRVVEQIVRGLCVACSRAPADPRPISRGEVEARPSAGPISRRRQPAKRKEKQP